MVCAFVVRMQQNHVFLATGPIGWLPLLELPQDNTNIVVCATSRLRSDWAFGQFDQSAV